MPFPRTWSEELITEWLHIEGFLVEANLPVGAGRGGGRKETDVVGARIRNGALEVIHIETGVLAQGEEGIERVIGKFSPEIVETVTRFFSQRLSDTGDRTSYRKVYIPTYWPQNEGAFEEPRAQGVEILTMPDFICNKVVPTITRWKQNPPFPLGGESATLPGSHWLLQLVDHLNTNGMLECKKSL